MDDEQKIFNKIKKNIKIAIAQKKDPALAYERVSNDQQLAGTSLELQNLGARQYADRNNILIVHQFEVAESAFRPHRKIFKRLIDCTIRFNIKILLFKSTDRMSRNYRDWEILNGLMETNDLNIHFYLNNRVLNRNMVFIQDMNMDMELMFAKFHSKKISHDIKEMNRHKASKGIAPYTTAPFGYKYDKSIKKFVKDPDHQKEVEFIFDEYDTFQYSLNQFVDILKAKGIKSPSGKSIWHKSQLWSLLRNCFYHGEFALKQQKKILPGNHEPYYDKARYEKRINLLSKNFINHKRRNKDYALAGMIRCSCGKLMTGGQLNIKIKGGKTRTDLIYAHKCPNKPKRTDGKPGGQITFHENKLFEILDNKISEISFSDDFVTKLKLIFKSYIDSSNKKHSSEHKTVCRKIDDLVVQKDRLIEAYAKQILNDVDALNLKIYNLNLQIEDLEKEKSCLENNVGQVLITVNGTIDKLREYGRVYTISTFKGKVEILNSLINEIYVDGSEVSFVWKKPFSFIVVPYIIELMALNKLKDAIVKPETYRLTSKHAQLKNIVNSIKSDHIKDIIHGIRYWSMVAKIQ